MGKWIRGAVKSPEEHLGSQEQPEVPTRRQIHPPVRGPVAALEPRDRTDTGDGAATDDLSC